MKSLRSQKLVRSSLTLLLKAGLCLLNAMAGLNIQIGLAKITQFIIHPAQIMILAKSAHNAKFVTFKVLGGCTGVV